jgi:hypothetical protein
MVELVGICVLEQDYTSDWTALIFAILKQNWHNWVISNFSKSFLLYNTTYSWFQSMGISFVGYLLHWTRFKYRFYLFWLYAHTISYKLLHSIEGNASTSTYPRESKFALMFSKLSFVNLSKLWNSKMLSWWNAEICRADRISLLLDYQARYVAISYRHWSYP